MSNDVSFETEELLFELNRKRMNAMSVALIAAKLDCSKREVLKRIDKARMELQRVGSSVSIRNNGHGSYYLIDTEEVAHDEQEKAAMLRLFTT